MLTTNIGTVQFMPPEAINGQGLPPILAVKTISFQRLTVIRMWIGIVDDVEETDVATALSTPSLDLAKAWDTYVAPPCCRLLMFPVLF